ncbi:MAG: hypothetical protein FJY67_07600 [Calditrichaeota bacterium]|nr:hypothetical protein [Calditrichota bacterium]
MSREELIQAAVGKIAGNRNTIWIQSSESKIKCNRAVEIGGKVLGDKWGTPDVIGRYAPGIEFVSFQAEIIFCEVKSDPSDGAALQGFGQAMAYGSYCHRTYLVLPLKYEVLGRMTTLCQFYGMGLITIDVSKSAQMKVFHTKAFNLILDACRREPDPDLLNEKLSKLTDDQRLALGYDVAQRNARSK